MSITISGDGTGVNTIIMRNFSGGGDINTGISHTTYPVANIASFDADAADNFTILVVNGDGNWHISSAGGVGTIVFYHKSIASRNF